ncbi:MAG: CDP-archaeol synthase [Candidatus Angelobacter sp. Gp1-AA117]|nr:MAG: CDP-archaeol synthase [Candidatus Angelobacter sp. Gp1-AA117]
MKRVLTAAVLIPLVLLAVFRAPWWLFALLIAVVIALSLYEYLNITRGYGIEPLVLPTYGWVILFLLANFAFQGELGQYMHPLNLVAFIPIFFGLPVVFRRDLRMALAASAVSAFAIFYLVVPLYLLADLRSNRGEAFLIIFILFSVWAGDTAAYYAGRAFGRHKLAPIVSPNKSWEGAIASVIASVAVALLVFCFAIQIQELFPTPSTSWETPSSSPRNMPAMYWVHAFVLGLLTNAAAQFGDLFESALKRGAQIKDSGSLLPGHGGILDRIDALLFAIPVVWYYARATELFLFVAR